MFEKGLLVLLWLLPFVRLEPAPVDCLIWAMGGYLFFKQPQAFWKGFPPLVRWGMLLLLAAHVSLIWAPELGRAAFYTLATLEMFVLLVLFAGRSRQPTAWRGLAFAYVGGSTLAAALGVLAYFGWLPYREIFMYGDMRAMALFKDPNVFGAYLVPAVILLWALMVTDPKSGLARRLAEGGIALLLTLGVLLAGSRAAWGGLVLGLGLYILLLLIWRRDWSRLRRGWALGLGMVLALAMAFHPQVWPMLEQRAALIKAYDHDRFSAQREALSSFLPSKIGSSQGQGEPAHLPRVGSSQGQGEPADLLRVVLHYAAGTGPGQSEVVLQYATHNLYLRIFYEHGIIGVLGLVLLLAAIGWGLRRSLSGGDPWRVTLTTILISLLVMSFLIDSLHWRHLFVFLGLALRRS